MHMIEPNPRPTCKLPPFSKKKKKKTKKKKKKPRVGAASASCLCLQLFLDLSRHGCDDKDAEASMLVRGQAMKKGLARAAAPMELQIA